MFKGLDALSEKKIVPEKLKGIDTSFIFGKEDRIATVNEVIKLKKMFPWSDFLFEEGAGHMPFLKDKGKLIRECIDGKKPS